MKMIESGYKCVYQEIVIMDLLQGHYSGAFNTDKSAKKIKNAMVREKVQDHGAQIRKE